MESILYIQPFSHIGGGEISLLTALRQLDRSHFNPLVVCYEQGPLLMRLRGIGIEPVIVERSSFFSNATIILRLLQILKKKHIALVHVNSLDFRASMACLLANVPYLGHLRVIFPFSWRDRFFVHFSRKTVAVSQAVINEFCKKYPGCRKKLVIIPNAVETSGEIKPIDLKQHFQLAKDSVLIGAVGRVDPMKGYEYFIDAAELVRRDVPNAFFFIVADTEQKEESFKRYFEGLKRKISEKGLDQTIFFSGFILDILAAIASFDILVVPSVEVQKQAGIVSEGFGRVAIEGMAVGTPVIVSRTGGLPEIVEDGQSGIVVPPADARAIASAIVALLRDSGRKDALIKAARQRFSELYTAEKYGQNLQELYLGVLGVQRLGRTCLLCNSSFFKIVERGVKPYKVLQCVHCSFTFVDPLPPKELLERNYSEAYYAPWVEEQKPKRRRMWKKRLHTLNTLTAQKGMLLDVGCAEGLFLETAASDGWRVTGTEISSFAVQYIKERTSLEAMQGEITEIEFSHQKFDAVTLWHVLEHTRNPLEVLKKVRAVMKENAVLLLAVPNLDNKIYQLLYRLLRGKRQHYFSPQDRELHLFFFNKNTIKLILELAGFEVRMIRPDTNGIRLSEKAVNLLACVYSMFTGKIFFDALEVHAVPNASGNNKQ